MDNRFVARTGTNSDWGVYLRARPDIADLAHVGHDCLPALHVAIYTLLILLRILGDLQ
jgi:hypothetical protein